MADDDANPPVDEFARTARDAPVVHVEEVAANRPDEAPVQPKKKERPAFGPMWAGTLPDLDAAPANVPSFAEEPPPAHVPYQPAPLGDDLAETYVQQPIFPVEIDEPRVPNAHKQVRRAPSGHVAAPPSAQSDFYLKIALAVIGVLIVLLVVGLVIGIAVELAEDEPASNVETEVLPD